MFIVSYLLFLCFLKFIFFRNYCEYFIVPGVSYSSWNSPSVTFFAREAEDFPRDGNCPKDVSLPRFLAYLHPV